MYSYSQPQGPSHVAAEGMSEHGLEGSWERSTTPAVGQTHCRQVCFQKGKLTGFIPLSLFSLRSDTIYNTDSDSGAASTALFLTKHLTGIRYHAAEDPVQLWGQMHVLPSRKELLSSPLSKCTPECS